jgi:hypothetical protein
LSTLLLLRGRLLSRFGRFGRRESRRSGNGRFFDGGSRFLVRRGSCRGSGSLEGSDSRQRGVGSNSEGGIGITHSDDSRIAHCGFSRGS